MSKNFLELSSEQKLRAIQKYLAGQGSTYSIGSEYGVSDTSIRRWVENIREMEKWLFKKSRFLPAFL